jgi:alanyl-tRNA synthetase
LIPENDPTVLFTTAGMHPLVPYLLGEKHPEGKRLADAQKCIRTVDFENIGDDTHNTFFEMLGNWSLGDYWKEDAIKWSFEFLTKDLNIPLERLAVSCFAGDKDAPKDEESAEIWQSLGVKKEKIAFLAKEDNWWGPAGQTGPCGPDTEMFYWKSNEKLAPEKFDPKDKNWVEIWNDVFMQYVKDESGNYMGANQKNVDTGMGMERTLAVLNGKENVYETDLFLPIIEKIKSLFQSSQELKNNRTSICYFVSDVVTLVSFQNKSCCRQPFDVFGYGFEINA